ncbi:dipeptide ABC transporter ATP-binding protein [Pseudofrankia inefficax]|uniref:Oligopeptide/dipeptide ABC transporter, ATPase subunit n=1 Tax=Pseudofrankia inefficax (strain DSM 45817 / CECT 9037 / DDB 130130 / EuI1c) TaxID=298654 RepID=E3J3R0_PSEI1|nr:ABC transporter ATP-binding protein [Pseudofrankia inefficax]ADP79397.1 oligopeptide/dipeptide ABC transporter, ATPase subunit [Pseudofrankia inefficax]
MTTPAALELRDLTVTFRQRGNDLPAVRGLDLTIAAGETYGLVGESGCGKSTTAYAVARYLAQNAQVTGGSIRVGGRDVLRLAGDQLRQFRATELAMVYQEPGAALNPTMRIGDQVAEVHVAHGMPVAAARAAATEDLGRVSLPDPRRISLRYPHELSGGQQQRVVLAMALAVRPRLLILDEPTTGLDATVEAEILDLVGRLQAELGFGVLMISHNLPLIASMCDRIGVLYAGRLVEEGPVDTLLRAPLHPYTAGLLRGVPHLRGPGREIALRPIPGRLAASDRTAPGCVFAARCSVATLECRETEPRLDAAAGEWPLHRARCFHPGSLDPRPPSGTSGAPRRPPGEPVVRIEHLTKRYDGAFACDDVNLEIRRGEVLGLVGESGSGKTTVARCLAGLVSYDGTIRVDGVARHPNVGRRDPRARRDLQMVFQQPDASLNRRRTAAAILGRAIRKLGGDWTVERLGDRVRLDAATLQRRSSQLSGGEKQRVAIGRAFAGRPAVVVCDEPVSALDVSVQAGILTLLKELLDTGEVSYLFISHDLGVVRYLADRIAVMYRGRIVEVGPAAEVLRSPRHPYTQLLLAAVPRLDHGVPARRRRPPAPGAARHPDVDTSGLESAAGCAFAGRCRHRIDGLCEVTSPPWRGADHEHGLRCHLTAPPGEAGGSRPSPAPLGVPTLIKEARSDDR